MSNLREVVGNKSSNIFTPFTPKKSHPPTRHGRVPRWGCVELNVVFRFGDNEISLVSLPLLCFFFVHSALFYELVEFDEGLFCGYA
jgi:hypothetical protein